MTDQAEKEQTKRSAVEVSLRVSFERHTATGGGIAGDAVRLADIPFVYCYGSDPADVIAQAIDLIETELRNLQARMEEEDERWWDERRKAAAS